MAPASPEVYFTALRRHGLIAALPNAACLKAFVTILTLKPGESCTVARMTTICGTGSANTGRALRYLQIVGLIEKGPSMSWATANIADREIAALCVMRIREAEAYVSSRDEHTSQHKGLALMEEWAQSTTLRHPFATTAGEDEGGVAA